MTKEDVIKYGAISLAMVLGGRFFANAAFAWLEGFFFKKSKDESSLDDLIRSKRYSLGGLSERDHARPRLTGQDPKLVTEELAPLEVKKRALMHRIYDVDLKRGQQETEEAYHLRLLGLSARGSAEELKRAYKLKSKALHPDMFLLKDFDAKTKKRLDGRIHENYVAIQRAFDYLKKTSK